MARNKSREPVPPLSSVPTAVPPVVEPEVHSNALPDAELYHEASVPPEVGPDVHYDAPGEEAHDEAIDEAHEDDIEETIVPRRWEVKHLYSPTLVIEADDEESAQVAYMRRVGLMDTIHDFKIAEITDGDST
jgi:hypothetical protein